MTAAIIYAFASAIFLGAGVVLAQLGLRTVEPLSGAAISVPSFTLLFLLLSPLILQGEPVVWAAVDPDDIRQGALGDCYFLAALVRLDTRWFRPPYHRWPYLVLSVCCRV